MMKDPALADISDIRHAFFTREGGVSDGIYDSLNCGFGSNDAVDHVQENRVRVVDMLGIKQGALVTAHQSHTADAVHVDAVWEPGAAPVADGMVTTQPGIALGILTADCAPVLMADPGAGVIGAAHAGWRGARGGVVERTIDLMVNAGAQPSRIVACIGPCIGADSYEVSDSFKQDFLDDDPGNEHYFCAARRPGHPYFDLTGYVANRLVAYGISQVQRVIGDTCAEADKFFSYRRSVLDGETDYGRGISVIALAAA